MKKSFFSIMLLLISYFSVAQVETPVDLTTGTLGVNIPLWNIQERDLQYPISLNYLANGVKVKDVAGWVGMNWSLSVEIAITRVVRGLPDDFLGTGTDTRKGWLHGDMAQRIAGFSVSTDNNPATCADEVANWNFINSFGYNEDTEPDIFYVTAPGLSFTFYFDQNKEIQIVPFQDLKVETLINSSDKSLQGFIVTSGTGVKYIFKTPETTTEKVTEPGSKDYFFTKHYEQYNVATRWNSSWNITEIVSPNSASVKFDYKTLSLSNSRRIGKMGGSSAFIYPLTIKDYLQTEIYPIAKSYTINLLKKITTSSTEIEFETLPRTDSTSSEKIKLISIFDTKVKPRKFIKAFEFAFSTVFSWQYSNNNDTELTDIRMFLKSVTEKASTVQKPSFEFKYYHTDGDLTSLPGPHHTSLIDVWGYFKDKQTQIPHEPVLTLDESYQVGSLEKITMPLGGYMAFFYEAHEFFNRDNNQPEKAGGIRIKKIISHAGTSSSADLIKEFRYEKSDGSTSGKILYRPRRTFKALRVPWHTSRGGYNLEVNVDLNQPETINSSFVGYEQVAVFQKGTGKTEYYFSMPASYKEETSNSEWSPSYHYIARPPATGYCYEKGSFEEGHNVFPYAPNPNYDFERGLPQKIITYREDGKRLTESIYTYQRVYKNAATNYIYGLSFEEIPTYYHNGSAYVDSKLFIYSKYKIFTGLRNSILKKVEITFSLDTNLKNEKTTTFYYNSPYHKELAAQSTINSDGTEKIIKYKYVKDFPVNTAGESMTAALKQLIIENRHGNIVETLFSEKQTANETVTGASLTTYQVIEGKVYPYQSFLFQPASASATFTAARTEELNGKTIFKSSYTDSDLNKVYNKFDMDGNILQVWDKSNITSSIQYGYSNSFPVVAIHYAGVDEVVFSDFETNTGYNFTLFANPSYSIGRTGSNALNMGAGSVIYKDLKKPENNKNTISCWIKSTSAGNLTIKLKSSGNYTGSPQYLAYGGGGVWKNYQVPIDVSSVTSSFTVEVSSNQSIQIDDIAFYPENATIATCTYNLPFGKSSETDAFKITTFYTYDEWGRVTSISDAEGNILKTFDYKIRP